MYLFLGLGIINLGVGSGIIAGWLIEDRFDHVTRAIGVLNLVMAPFSIAIGYTLF